MYPYSIYLLGLKGTHIGTPLRLKYLLKRYMEPLGRAWGSLSTSEVLRVRPHSGFASHRYLGFRVYGCSTRGSIRLNSNLVRLVLKGVWRRQ